MEKEIRQYNNAQLIPYFVEMINQGHTVTFKLKGFSMRPFLEDGRDKAILGKHTTVRCGDAVLAEISPCQSSGRPVRTPHREYRRRQGDAARRRQYRHRGVYAGRHTRHRSGVLPQRTQHARLYLRTQMAHLFGYLDPTAAHTPLPVVHI